MDDKNNLPSIYGNANIGTENINQEDMNTPTLKIVQSNTQGIENKKDGAYFRTDIKEQFDNVEVNLVYVSSAMVENYNKDGMEKVKMYYGFYAGTKDPFKMYVRGWGLSKHREFQTEFATLKHRFNIPMLALTVDLTTEKKAGTIEKTGKPYVTYMPVFNIVKDTKGVPLVEVDRDRVNFLIESARRFADISNIPSANDDEQNALIDASVQSEDEVQDLLTRTPESDTEQING